MPRKNSKGRGWNNNRPQQRRDNSERRQYYGHDDRTLYSDRDSVPRVSFKTSRIGKGGRGERHNKDRQRDLEAGLRRHLDDDTEMSDEVRQNRGRSSGWRGNARGMGRARARRNSPVPSRGVDDHRQRNLHAAPANCYKVHIPNAATFDKEYLLEILTSHLAPDTLIPIMYKLQGNDVTFYIDEFTIANKLLKADRQIITNNGAKLNIKVRPYFPPAEVDQQFKDRIKIAIVKRYVTASALDLSQFHRDKDLYQDMFCALFQPKILTVVIDIISEHTPNLEALNLDGNKLQNIDRFGTQLHTKLPNLSILHLSNNRIRDLKAIDALKQLKLKELRLLGNPICDKYKQRPEEFISDIRKRFPKLLKLDDMNLPPPIGFEIAADEDASKLPVSQRVFSITNETRQVADAFLHQYFLIFDSDNRQPLLNAYDEQASFSLTIACKHDNLNRFKEYLPHNRNLFRITDRERRLKLMKQGRLPVVSFLSEIPKTKHCFNSFSMDISLCSQVAMVVMITGVFQEVETDKKELRYFSRSLLIVPQGSGFCIRNEQLHITEPTDDQKKQALTELSADNSNARITESSGPVVAQQDPHLQMAMALSQQSGMNLEWSRECLIKVQWNFDMALAAFKNFHELGQVPPQAFQK
ncbi:nuclear RNA export factor 1-like [Diprion similis]|uniref:nuclear RNA export factor 1-like n=1 Tax=Diprion similis TaxID=362088 RepID=UPI001EF794C3|nr:nuclear RNA export factor 1-like [Diprion similis]